MSAVKSQLYLRVTIGLVEKYIVQSVGDVTNDLGLDTRLMFVRNADLSLNIPGN